MVEHEVHSEEKQNLHKHIAHKIKHSAKQPSVLWIIIAVLALLLIISITTCGFKNCSKEKYKTQQIVQNTTQNTQQQNQQATVNTTQQQPTRDGTFIVTTDQPCKENGKPLIMLFSTTWCPHCKWIKDTFDNTVKSYGDKIAAYHWEIDTGDNTLTSAVETQVPANLMAYYKKYNPGGSIPTFVLGCEYTRIGNGYERQQNLTLEENELRQKIGKLIAG